MTHFLRKAQKSAFLSLLVCGLLLFSHAVEAAPVSDFNNDGKVNCDDFSIFKAAYGVIPGMPNWNPVCDIAEPYGIIDFEDYMLFLIAFKEAIPEIEEFPECWTDILWYDKTFTMPIPPKGLQELPDDGINNLKVNPCSLEYSYTILPVPEGWLGSYAFRINDAGDVAGHAINLSWPSWLWRAIPWTPEKEIEVVITFDDGPVGDIHPITGQNYTARIMRDLERGDLNRYQDNIKAAFFILTHMENRGGTTIGEEIIRWENMFDHVVAVHGGGRGDHKLHPERVKIEPYDVDAIFDYNGDGLNDPDGIRDGKNALESDLIAAKKKIRILTGTVPEFVRPPYWNYGQTWHYGKEIKKRVLETYARQNLKIIMTDVHGGDTGYRTYKLHPWEHWKMPPAGLVRDLLIDGIKKCVKDLNLKQIVVTLHDWNDRTAENLALPDPSYLDAIVEGVRRALNLNTREEAARRIRFVTSSDRIRQIFDGKPDNPDEWPNLPTPGPPEARLPF